MKLEGFLLPSLSLTKDNKIKTRFNFDTQQTFKKILLIYFVKVDNSSDIRFCDFRNFDDWSVQSIFQGLDLLLQKFYRWGRIRFCRRRYFATCNAQMQMLTWLYDRFITATSLFNVQFRGIYASGLQNVTRYICRVLKIVVYP